MSMPNVGQSQSPTLGGSTATGLAFQELCKAISELSGQVASLEEHLSDYNRNRNLLTSGKPTDHPSTPEPARSEMEKAIRHETDKVLIYAGRIRALIDGI